MLILAGNYNKKYCLMNNGTLGGIRVIFFKYYSVLDNYIPLTYLSVFTLFQCFAVIDNDWWEPWKQKQKMVSVYSNCCQPKDGD